MKRKATTLKDFKKSNKKLYDDLMREKARHSAASDKVNELKTATCSLLKTVERQQEVINFLENKIDNYDQEFEQVEDRGETVTKFTAALVKELT